MNIEYIKARIKIIEDCKDDDESAHSKEDKLWEEVLLVISAGAPNPRELAEEALKTREIEFARWCA